MGAAHTFQADKVRLHCEKQALILCSKIIMLASKRSKKYGYPYARHEGIMGSRGATPFLNSVLHKGKSRIHALPSSEKKLLSCSCRESNPRTAIPKHHI